MCVFVDLIGFRAEDSVLGDIEIPFNHKKKSSHLISFFSKRKCPAKGQERCLQRLKLQLPLRVMLKKDLKDF